ncbi:hypothetical protein [Absidia glauca]|uniref:MULE transposase domain-containing protein n=1 Tax=Absidia glauca TaxID=4829 RepID=A0A168L7P7_ABSGL|nr:hypothetical protein [Absidia glauca]
MPVMTRGGVEVGDERSRVNAVGVSNIGRNFHSLANFPIAGAWISSETETSYQWVVEQLEKTVFPNGSSWRPGVIVTGREQALMNAIENVFPDANPILYCLHIARNFKENMAPFEDNPEEKWLEVNAVLERIFRSRTMDDYHSAYKDYIAVVALELDS